MDKKILEVSKLICRKLKNHDVKWVYSGSTSLALQGIDVHPTDIDITTDRDGAYSINEILKSYEVKPIEFGIKGSFRSYFGNLIINDIKIDILGDFSLKVGKKWINVSNPRLKAIKTVKIGNYEMPVTPLENHLEIYKAMNRDKDKEKIRKIEQALGR